MIQAVIFDMDGVLFDTERLSRRIIGDAALKQGFTLSDEAFHAMLGTTAAESKSMMSKWYPGLDYDVMMRQWEEMMLAYIKEHGMPLKKGVPEVFRLLQDKGIKIGLATSTRRSYVVNYLEHAGIDNVFDAMVCASEAQRSKPAPDIYIKCAEQLGILPKHCAGVEDSLNGVKAVRAAGMRCIMVPDILPYTAVHAPFVDTVIADLTHLLPELTKA